MFRFPIRILAFPKRRIFVLITLLLIAFLSAVYLCTGKYIFSNSSPSAPLGIYVTSFDQELHPGDYVVVKSPKSFPAPLNIPKGYYLLKQVRGYAGEHYTVTPSYVTINGQAFLTAPDVPELSYLPRLPEGEYTIPEGFHLYLNDSTISFDSRYLGPVSDQNIVHKVSLLIDYKAMDSFLLEHLPTFLTDSLKT